MRQEGGDYFYCLRLNDQLCLAFSTITGTWHMWLNERPVGGYATIGQNVFVFGDLTTGQADEGRLMKTRRVSGDGLTFHGPLQGIIKFPVLTLDNRRTTCHAFRVDVDTTQRETTLADTTIESGLAWHDDDVGLGGGSVKSQMEIVQSHDPSTKSLVWRQLGQFRKRRFELRVERLNGAVITNAWVQIDDNPVT